MSSLDVEGKVAVITGGLGGIGFEIVKLLLHENIKGVTVVDVNEALAKKKIEEVKGYIDKILFCKADVSNKEEFENVFKRTVHRFKNVDILINNAAVADDLKWEKMVPVNLNGVINGTLLAMDRYILNHKTTNEGLILNTGSVAGLTPIDSYPVYSSIKSAVIHFSRALGADYHYNRTKIRIVSISPGSVATELINEMDQRCLKMEYRERFLEECKEKFSTSQKPEDVGKAILKVIKQGKSGSSWVIENDELYEIKFPDYANLKIK